MRSEATAVERMGGEKENFKRVSRLPQLSAGGKTTREFRKALAVAFDSPFAQPFLDRQLSKGLTSRAGSAESTGTGTRDSDFCNVIVWLKIELVTTVNARSEWSLLPFAPVGKIESKALGNSLEVIKLGFIGFSSPAHPGMSVRHLAIAHRID